MLHLKSDTSAAWGAEAARCIDVILVDHAHLEKKAASAALRVLFMYPEHPELQRPLSALAREELEHFEAVLDHLDARGVPFVRQKPSPYFAALHKAVRREEPARLLDTLLCCALIEARSCERMKVLAEALDAEPALKAFYDGLLASEARHFRLYTDLAGLYFPAEVVRDRLEMLALREAEALAEPGQLPRMHS